MNYIWDIVLRAKEQGILKEELFFKSGKETSPWPEQSFPCINQKTIDSTEIEINPLVRFDHIFQRLLHVGLEGSEEFKEYLLDLSLHFLCDIDLYKGITKKEIYIHVIQSELAKGVYGDNIGEQFSLLSIQDKKAIATLLLTQIEIGISLSLFRKATNKLYENALLYQMKEEPNRILLYLGMANTPERSAKTELLISLFSPIQYETRVFWDCHFGVLTTDETMRLGAIEIF